LSSKRASTSTIGTERVPEGFTKDFTVLLKLDGRKFSELISSMENNLKKLPLTKEFSAILDLPVKDARAARRAFLWLLYRFSIGAFSAEEITDYVEAIDEDREKGVQLCQAFQKMSPQLHNIMRLRGLFRYVGDARVVPHFHAMGHTLEFRPISLKGKTVAIVPLVTLNFVAFKEGENVAQELLVEVNANEFARLKRTIEEIFEQLKAETTSLSQKLGDIVLSLESAESLGESW